MRKLLIVAQRKEIRQKMSEKIEADRKETKTRITITCKLSIVYSPSDVIQNILSILSLHQGPFQWLVYERRLCKFHIFTRR